MSGGAKNAMRKLQMHDILYRNNHLLIVNKVAGILSQRDGTSKPDMVTMAQRWLKEHAQKSGNVFVGLPHRLDEAASGVLCLTRTSKAASRMAALFANREVEKEYLAVVEGQIETKGIIPGKNTSYAQYWESKGRFPDRVDQGVFRKDQIDGELHWSVLNFPISLESEKPMVHSLIAVRTTTGRKHQIRRQLASIGHPIIGDTLYGSSIRIPKPPESTDVASRILLHASSLRFPNPVAEPDTVIRKEKISEWSREVFIKAQVPRYWKQVLKGIVIPGLDPAYKSYFDQVSRQDQPILSAMKEFVVG